MRGSAQRRALASFEQTTRSSHGANMRMRPRDFCSARCYHRRSVAGSGGGSGRADRDSNPGRMLTAQLKNSVRYLGRGYLSMSKRINLGGFAAEILNRAPLKRIAEVMIGHIPYPR